MSEQLKINFTQAEQKYCGKCKEWKSRAEFSKHKATASGLQPFCRQCKRQWQLANTERIKEINRQWYLANAEKAKEKSRRWYLANTEKAKEKRRQWNLANTEKAKEQHRQWHLDNIEKAQEKNRQWYLANTEKAKEIARQWRLAHSEQNKENCRQWRLANTEKTKEARRQWYLDNTEKAQETNRQWRLANPEGATFSRMKSRAKKLRIPCPAGVKLKIIAHLSASRTTHCPYCNAIMVYDAGDKNAHCDHIKPVHMYPELFWEPTNLQWLCGTCNLQKGHRTPEEFVDYIKKQYEEKLPLIAATL